MNYRCGGAQQLAVIYCQGEERERALAKKEKWTAAVF